MNYKLFIILCSSLFLLGCDNQNSSLYKKDNFKIEEKYTNKGFTYIFSNDDKFKKLDGSNAYHGLTKDLYYQLMNGKAVEVDNMPNALIKGKYVEPLKAKKLKES